MQKIVVASSNEGKLVEIRNKLNLPAIELISQQTLGITDADETGLTFVENAILKARHAAECSGLPALADDSGLVVEALNGEPGVYSARYAASNGAPVSMPPAQVFDDSTKSSASDSNIRKLLNNLESVPDGQRNAYFYCVMVLLRYPNDPTPIICQGRWDGSILLTPQGEKGFGYDPIFYVPTHQCSAAELPLEIKNTLSHRGQALQQLLKYFERK